MKIEYLFSNTKGNLSTRYGYTGREFDADLGLQYSRARWYDATLGRFISEDPIGFAGGDVNLYGYVGNNPIKYVVYFGNERYTTRFYNGDYESLRNPLLTKLAEGIDLGFLRDTYKNAAPIENKCECSLENPEIKKMKNIFYDEVSNMTDSNQRIYGGSLNNTYSSLQMIRNLSMEPSDRVLGCGEQADELNARLTGKFDSKWRLTTENGYHRGFYHQYSVANSSNPSDPVIILDAWNDHFETRRRR
jgi:RHS repeat-associated protein